MKSKSVITFSEYNLTPEEIKIVEGGELKYKGKSTKYKGRNIKRTKKEKLRK